MNSTRVRLQIAEENLIHPSLDCVNFKDIIKLSGDDLIEEISIDYFRWFFTALTLASDKLYLLNFPERWFNEEVF